MKTEHESTTQKHMKNVPHTVRPMLLKTTNLQWTKENEHHVKYEDEIDESHKSRLEF